jgi:hypothetical protein
MSTYTIHSPIGRRHSHTTGVALHAGPAVVIAVCVLAALIAVAFLAAAPATSIHVKHMGRAAVVSATDQTGTVVVASNGAASVTATKTATPVRPWRETLRGRAIILTRSAAPAAADLADTGQ